MATRTKRTRAERLQEKLNLLGEYRASVETVHRSILHEADATLRLAQDIADVQDRAWVVHIRSTSTASAEEIEEASTALHLAIVKLDTAALIYSGESIDEQAESDARAVVNIARQVLGSAKGRGLG